MSTSVYEVFEAIRTREDNNRDRGTRFEQLMVEYLREDPQWADQFSQVWM
ncbi:hypothetical protein AB0M32_39080 [Streptomyces sp. NPDC051985]